MPFYEYQCSACQHHVEVLQKISDAPLRKCPDCGKSALKRLISAPVFRLKGGGWYETDFKSDNETKRNIHGREETADSSSEGAKASNGSADAAKPAEASAAGNKAAEKKTEKAKPAARSKAAAKPAARAKSAKSKAAPKKRASR